MRSFVLLLSLACMVACGSFGEGATGGGNTVDAGTPDSSAGDGSGPTDEGCTGNVVHRDAFADRPDPKGAWTETFSEGGGSLSVQGGVLAISVPQILDVSKPRTAMGHDVPSASRVCLSFTLSLAAPPPSTVYAPKAQVILGYIAPKWSDGRTTFAGLTLVNDGPSAYAEHTDGEYEFQTSLGIREPGVRVMIAADFTADSIEIFIGPKKHSFKTIRGIATGSPVVVYVVLGISQHGPVASASATYDDVRITSD